MKKSCLALLALLLAGMGTLRADQITAAVQQALKEQGFYYGDVTGEKSADTTAAIRRYQIRNGLQITGEIDAETLRSLGVGAAGARATPSPQPAAPPPAEEAETEPGEEENPTQSAELTPAPDYGPGPSNAPKPPVYPRAVVNNVFAGTPYEMAPPDLQRHVIVGAQTLLARYGFYRSGIDGEFGPGTEAAIRAFQARADLVADGRLNMATLGALGLLPGQRGPHFAPAPRRLRGRPVYRGEWIPDR